MDRFNKYRRTAENFLSPKKWYQVFISRAKAQRILHIAETEWEKRTMETIEGNRMKLELLGRACEAEKNEQMEKLRLDTEIYQKRLYEAARLAFCSWKCPYLYKRCFKHGCARRDEYLKKLTEEFNKYQNPTNNGEEK